MRSERTGGMGGRESGKSVKGTKRRSDCRSGRGRRMKSGVVWEGGKASAHKAERRQRKHRNDGHKNKKKWNRRIKEEENEYGRNSEGGGSGSDKRRIRKVRSVKREGGGEKTLECRPIKISGNSIHSTWKRELGGLIRYYINVSTKSASEAEQEIEALYYRSGCCVENTKLAIVRAIDGQNRTDGAEAKGGNHGDGWIAVDMAIESTPGAEGGAASGHSPTADGKGRKLEKTVRAGEGPAHAHERWTNVIVPQWAVGRSFFFEMRNRSALDLSCEMTLDGQRVASNVPLPRRATRTVRPDNRRYFRTHAWVLRPAARAAFRPSHAADEHKPEEAARRPPQRCNGIRPDYNKSGANSRVDIALFPDPRAFGWTFTGSLQASLVEFYQKDTNMGTVELDFYYTTATLNTVLHHPSTGPNQLFRGSCTPDIYLSILQNPRAHTDRGYRYKTDAPHLQPHDARHNATGDHRDDHQSDQHQNTIYYAKNDQYDFKTQGHAHRRHQMHKLQQTQQYNAWHQAVKQEYAVLHAKFYVSLVDVVRHRRQPQPQQQQRKKEQLEPLPDQATIIDVKAAEKATLGTKFQPLSTTDHPPRTIPARSRLRVKRIQGLNDDPQFTAKPLFEYKLYYRAQHVLHDTAIHTDDDTDNDDDATPMDTETQHPMHEQHDIDQYKADKSNQVAQYHAENKILNQEQADDMLADCHCKITLATSVEDVDEQVKIYYDHMRKAYFHGSFVV